ncbi:NADH dehydrogenase [ubiquinone] 1 beta subcomplex subunit 9-like [Pieris rapae]|uniref:NADH dehydrogenase [ubiquinone] 1 beta subcomplex subunit 9-like n=1 Tax=Pieris rapae TaxID=64459 RepID=UPI000B926325|nr:NADH dehydrogenase [ubiquinone] 1 beta subcomplex subunit 9-like [Pieris rapae]
MATLPLGIKTQTQKLCNLYKRAIRNLESYYDRRHVFRFQAVLLRERFDKIAALQDQREFNKRLQEEEDSLFAIIHPIPKKFPLSPGGVAYARVVTPPDWVLDYWHPLEKAQYPEYFKRREERKKEFVAMWEKEFGKEEPKDKHH